MMINIFRNSIFIYLALLLFSLSTASGAESSCSAGTTPEFEEIKKLIHQVRDSGAIPKSVKDDIVARYEESVAMDKSIINGTHPYCIKLFEYDKEAADYEYEISLFRGRLGVKPWGRLGVKP